jgi:spore germination protein YaaH
MFPKFRFFILFLSLIIWIFNGLYAFYVNRLKMEQYKLTTELRKLRKENDLLYYKIAEILNYQNARKEAYTGKFVDVKPYRVIDFWETLKGKPLIDFYFVWFNDNLSKISKKLNVPLEEIKKLNPSTRWGYVIPGMRLKIPVTFPYVVQRKGKTSKGTQSNNPTSKVNAINKNEQSKENKP